MELEKNQPVKIGTSPQFMPRLRLSATPAGMTLEWIGEPGVPYEVKSSDTLVNWTYMTSVNTPPDTGGIIRIPLQTNGKFWRFYRIVADFPR